MAERTDGRTDGWMYGWMDLQMQSTIKNIDLD